MLEKTTLHNRVSGKLKTALSPIKNRFISATTFNQNLYDLLHFHASRHTMLGKMLNVTFKIGFRFFSYLNHIKQPAQQPVVGRSSFAEQNALFLKPLTQISDNKGQRILIIAEVSLPQCYKYRVRQKQEMLNHLGYCVTVCSWNDFPAARRLLQTHGLVIFYRVPGEKEVRRLMDECERLNLETLFDIDDLIFDMEEYSQNSNIIALRGIQKTQLLESIELYRYTLERCRHAIASTHVIARFMKKYCQGQIYVVENCIDTQMFCLEKELRKNAAVNHPDHVLIGYGSGTTTHDVDFQECAHALADMLKSYPNVRLAIHGHLQLPQIFKPYQSQIYRIPFLLADDYYRALASFDINLAPLENTLFNDAKSNIKFIEASIFSIPTIASPTDSFRRVIVHGENGFLCSSREEWKNALSALIQDRNLRAAIGQKAREKALSVYDYKKLGQKQLKPIIHKHLPATRKKTKVLLVNTFFSPFTFGGPSVVAEALSSLLNQSPDMEVFIFTGILNHKENPDALEQIIRYESLGMPVFAVKIAPFLDEKTDYCNDKIKEHFQEVLACVQPDIVHFHDVRQLGASLAEPCVARKIPYVITLHDTWWLCERQFMIKPDGIYCAQRPVEPRVCVNGCSKNSAQTFGRFFYLRRILQSASLLLAPSKFQKNVYVANGFKEKQIQINKNGVHPVKENFYRKKNDRVRFAYLGGNLRHKGYHWLKEIFNAIELSQYSLLLTDLSADKNAINKSEWQIKGELILSDGYRHDALDHLFSDIDVLLFPSQCEESFGLVVREALIRGIWVISTDTGGSAQEIIHGKNGQVFDPKDSDGFQKAVMDAIEYSVAGHPTPKKQIRLFSDQVQELSGFYETVLKPSRQTPNISTTPGITSPPQKKDLKKVLQ